MNYDIVSDCWRDSWRLWAIASAMYRYPGTEGQDEDWPHNCISIRTVAYSCGTLCRSHETINHRHKRSELERCSRLSIGALEGAAGVELGMGNESCSPMFPFFVTANIEAEAPNRITPEYIRAAFGGTIYPPAEIVVEPLEERGVWWDSVTDYYEGYHDRETKLHFWRRMIRWFAEQPDFRDTAFVMIGEDPLGGGNLGCVFPRLALGLTEAGSLVGVGGCVVHT